MNLSSSSCIVLDGFRVEDKICDHNALKISHLDLSIFVIGWEERSISTLMHANVSGKKALLVSFKGDGISESDRQTYFELASQKFDDVVHKEFCNARDVDELRGEIETLVDDIADGKLTEIAVDYSSMPRVMVQTFFRLLMSEGVCPRIHWIYSAGKYDNTEVVDQGFHQGVSGDLFSVHGAYGAGAVSEKRIGIAALGGDQELVAMFLRHENYDDLFFVDAPSMSSPKLQQKIEKQREWLQSEHGIDPVRFSSCSEHKVVEAIKVISKIISSFERYPNTSFDIFCAGPKSHSVAASALISKFENVRLLGRVPGRYARLNVLPTGTCTSTCVSDYTNIRLAGLLVRTG